ncbi:plasmid pRiA4b ORF-3-like protein (plasmid) [Ketogulonicigenium robustum]|uniref:Plasmid pRiA4b ORF-3-like protein n=1 Tax=Ketogulonicigenium robustum TaxID=92947 RepID=A0A1W6P3R1_9RHOB|nr:DUF2726 domain-containing protein [Ketogulonicigenium robustum]ARO16021.1 plasmid pRiA4b ORF-3-like protein [Ketogulonicigenium robustum]
MTDINFTMIIGFLVVIALVGGVYWFVEGRKSLYSSKQLMNKSEFRLYNLLNRWRHENRPDLILSPQVPYGAFIQAQGNLWRGLVAKRADFVIWSKDGFVRAIIEYDGPGHHGKNSASARKVIERDKLKDKAALKANFALIRVYEDTSEADILADIINTAVADPIRYVYDFGDYWVHLIETESVDDPIPENLYPRLVDVVGRCPPEDVGGLPGYENFIEAIGDAAHPEHEELTQWVEGPFDPHIPDGDELRRNVLKLAKKWQPKKK